MAEIIEARHIFAPMTDNEFESGQLAEPGIYLDVQNHTMITLNQADTLPDEVRIMRLPRRYRRFENRGEALTFLEEALKQAA